MFSRGPSVVVVVGPLPRPSPNAPGPAHAHAWHPSLHLSSISISKRATYRRRSTKGRERGRYVKNCQNVSLSLSLLGLFLAAGCSSGRKHENALSLLGEGRRRKKDRGERERTRRNIKKEVEIGSLSGRKGGRKAQMSFRASIVLGFTEERKI